MTITAKVIADSASPDGIRLTTLQLRYPKFIHGEFLTHRVFSRNSSSSRAIPVERLIQDVIDDPVIPSFWGKNQKGMQANEECNELILGDSRDEVWKTARYFAIDVAREFTRAGYHKQIVNRLLEPFCHINTVVTATEWDNFFTLRCHKDAQPEIRLLAEAMRKAMDESRPKKLGINQWHMPYIVESDWAEADAFGRHLSYVFPNDDEPRSADEIAMENLVKASVARCARVSYFTHEGYPSSIVDDLKLFDRLIKVVPAHASPAEHQATPDMIHPHRNIGFDRWKNLGQHGNFRGWRQYRKMLGL